MKVLIAPLNWGIGHATRSIPIILHHLEQGDSVFLASSGDAFLLLKNRFPNLTIFPLPDYNIQYSKIIPVWISVCLQSLKVLKAITNEREEVKRLQIEYEFDLIISDNRYGIYHPNVDSHFICHQLNPKSPFPFTQNIVERIHRYACKPFNKILIPDYINSELTGDLSQTNLLWKNRLDFIGPLSQLEVSNEKVETSKILVLLSGKEPQRSILEKAILNEIQQWKIPVSLVGGRLDNQSLNFPIPEHVNYLPFLDKLELENEIANASIIICRSGYSTIMDIHQLSTKRIILIPTPGQTEQEYLAKYLSSKFEHFDTQKQSQLNLLELIKNIT